MEPTSKLLGQISQMSTADLIVIKNELAVRETQYFVAGKIPVLIKTLNNEINTRLLSMMFEIKVVK